MAAEYVITLKDMASGPMAQAAQGAISLKTHTDESSKSIDGLREHLRTLEGQRGQSFSKEEISKFNTEIRQTQRELEKLENLPPQGFMHRLGSMKGLIEGAGIAFGAIEVKEFLGKSLEVFNEMEQSDAQLKTGIISTNGAAKRSFEDLNEAAKKYSETTLFGDDEVKGTEKILLTFTNIKGAIFDKATPAVLDFAQKMKIGPEQAALQLGKALNDPILGVTTLRREGVQLSDQQQELVKHFMETGQVAKAQTIILQEMQKEFGGSAEAAGKAGTGPITILGHKLHEVEERIGRGVNMALKAFMPIMEGAINVMNGFITFISNNSEAIKDFGISIGIAAGAWGIYKLVVNSVSLATKLYTGVQWLLNAALNANPIGIIIVSVAALTGAIIYLWNTSDKFRGFLYGLGSSFVEVFSIIKDVGYSILMGIGKLILGIFTFDKNMIKEGAGNLVEGVATVRDAGKRLGQAYAKGQKEGVDSFAKDQEKKKAAENQTTTTTSTGGAGGTGLQSGLSSVEGDAKASRNVTINIDSLIKSVNIHSSVKEAVSNIKEHLSKALLEVANDANLVAA